MHISEQAFQAIPGGNRYHAGFLVNSQRVHEARTLFEGTDLTIEAEAHPGSFRAGCAAAAPFPKTLEMEISPAAYRRAFKGGNFCLPQLSKSGACFTTGQKPSG
jgi:hypothetical protein